MIFASFYLIFDQKTTVLYLLESISAHRKLEFTMYAQGWELTRWTEVFSVLIETQYLLKLILIYLH